MVVMFSSCDSFPSTVAALERQLVKLRKTMSARTRDKTHQWIETHFHAVEQLKPPEIGQMKAMLITEHSKLYEESRKAAERLLLNLSEKSPSERDRRLNKIKETVHRYRYMPAVFLWELEHVGDEDLGEKEQIQALCASLEAIGISRKKSDISKLEEQLQTIEQRKKDRLLLFCDLLEGISEGWDERMKMNRKVVRHSESIVWPHS